MTRVFDLWADGALVLHLGFILFVVLGGALLPRWPWLLWLHLPAVFWAAFIELSGGICPLTPLENALRLAAGARGYAEGFIEHYLSALIYPRGLTREIQVGLGLGVVVLNGWFYGRWWWRRH